AKVSSVDGKVTLHEEQMEEADMPLAARIADDKLWSLPFEKQSDSTASMHKVPEIPKFELSDDFGSGDVERSTTPKVSCANAEGNILQEEGTHSKKAVAKRSINGSKNIVKRSISGGKNKLCVESGRGREVAVASDKAVDGKVTLHEEQMEEADMPLATRIADDKLWSLPFEKQSDSTASIHKVPEIPKFELSDDFGSGDVERSTTPKVSCPNAEGNILQEEGTRSKKAVAKRSINGSKNIVKRSISGGKNKLCLESGRGGEVTVASDKAVASSKPEIKSVSEQTVNDSLKHEQAVSKEASEAVELYKRNVALKDKQEVLKNNISGRHKKTQAIKQKKKSLDPGKENNPEGYCSVSFESKGDEGGNLVSKSDEKSAENGHVSGGHEIEPLTNKAGKVASLGPAWFILSGHRFQRKEFQAVIKRLRGRLCRDSHHWSYQATHFIVPDPVRRTEKFFAAAAAGRWILKADYLTASSEAGKFLEEEPFEWNRKGLTEDGAVSLEAPRKWRLLRERTGHGAFYGMRIIIYGECIAPTLDTLKRVVKAGDGTILATSPPYTRFLKSGVDFAVVGPGMPSVDSWVQEFLRHEVPCITADYLVEYVCKPGYSLERHILYNTNTWAEKSFANLLSLSEEIVADSAMPLEGHGDGDDDDDDDISCTVCGSRERGEVMLICGNEGGTVGCGIGTHIDCCNPPMEAIPEGDWFCAKCSISRAKRTLQRTKTKSLRRK
ncbi:BRCT domain-containing protein, partial [Ananas comosus]